jgi:hypothetical protein
MNLNGDYVSDALAAQVGGIGIAPGANINYQTGRAGCLNGRDTCRTPSSPIGFGPTSRLYATLA